MRDGMQRGTRKMGRVRGIDDCPRRTRRGNKRIREVNKHKAPGDSLNAENFEVSKEFVEMLSETIPIFAY